MILGSVLKKLNIACDCGSDGNDDGYGVMLIEVVPLRVLLAIISTIFELISSYLKYWKTLIQI